MLLQACLEDFEDARYGEIGEATLTWYMQMLSSLGELYGDVPIEAMTPQQMQAWRRHVFQGVTINTRRGYITAVKVFFSWCIEAGYITTSPAARLRMPPLPDQEPKAISPEDRRKMLNAATTHRDRAVLYFLADTGCRAEELCNLPFRDLALDSRRAYVYGKGKGGKGKGRWIFFSKHTRSVLAAYLRERSTIQPQDALFIGLRGPLQYDGVYQLVKRVAEKAGVTKRHNPHSFRHAAARDWLQNGADLATVSQLLGHSDVGVTARYYGRWSISELSDWHNRVSPFSIPDWIDGSPIDYVSIGERLAGNENSS